MESTHTGANSGLSGRLRFSAFQRHNRIRRNIMAAPVVTLQQLIEAGAHFGHQTHRWNPKM
ncbi:MAG: hypothetical protein ABJM59_08135, partial [Parasphingorhabdus sp.]